MQCLNNVSWQGLKETERQNIDSDLVIGCVTSSSTDSISI